MELLFYKSKNEYRLVYFPTSFLNKCNPGDILQFNLVDGGRKPVVRCLHLTKENPDYESLKLQFPDLGSGEIIDQTALTRMKWSDDVKRDLEWRPRVMQIAVSGMLETASEMRRKYFPSLQDLRTGLLNAMSGKVFSTKSSSSEVWSHWKDKPLSFLDGGVGRIDFLGMQPVLIRVGVFTVRLSEKDLLKREQFDFFPVLFGDIYQTGDGFSEDLEELKRDSARMIAEIAGAFRFLKHNEDAGVLLVHGPLINTLSPYVGSEKGIPEYVEDIWEKLVGGEISCPLDGVERRNFVPLYKFFIEGVVESGTLVAGIIERTKSREYLQLLMDTDFQKFSDFNFTDALVLSLILQPGQYTGFEVTRKNDLRRAAPRWKSYIADLPSISFSYLQVNEEYPPFRVEIPTEYTEDKELIEILMSYIYSCARILSRYAFPVGLDIIDKYAKIPDWMSSSAVKLARQALYSEIMKTHDTEEMSLILKVMSLQARDFFFRPKI